MTAQPPVTPARRSSARSSSLGMVVPFVLISLIWGSTWLVIKDQISTVPASWTITWRFLVASVGMVVLAAVRRESLRLPPGAQRMALLVAVTQFVLNFQFVYRSEAYLPSGVVAVLYALLMVPNTILSAIWLKSRVSLRFLVGSGVAVAGIGLLMLHEIRLGADGAGGIDGVWLGMALALGGLLSASVSNVAQATPAARAAGPIPFLAWAMIWGTLIDAVWALVTVGAPVFEARPAYWGGIAYLGLLGSVFTFPVYFNLIRTIGAGKAAYTGVATPIVAMLLSTLFEGYRWTGLTVAGSVLAMIGLLIALGSRKGA